MQQEIIKWLNSFSNFPIGKLIVDYNQENSGFSNLNELLFDIMDGLKHNYVTVRPIDIDASMESQMPENYLCYNSEREKINSKSIKYIKDYSDAKKYDYILIPDPDIRISLTSKHVFYLLTKYSHILIVLLGIIGTLSFKLSYLSLLLVLQGIVIFLLFELAFQKKNKTLSSVCKIGSTKDSCLELQKKSGLILNYFEFSEAGLIYFLSLFLWTIIYVLNPLASSINFLILHFGLIAIFLYSTYKQIENKIYCPICIFTDIVIVIQFIWLYIFFDFNNLPILSLTQFSFLLFTFFFAFLIVTLKKLLSFYQKSTFKNDYTIKEIMIENSNTIFSNFKKVKVDTSDLSSIAFKNDNNITLSDSILFCINLDCPSCVDLAHKLRYLVNSKFDINIVIYIKNTHTFNLNSPEVTECIYLGVIFEHLGVLEFSKSLIGSKFVNNRLNYFNDILTKHQILLDENKKLKIWNRLKQQSKYIGEKSIIDFPYIVRNDKLIPPYINPKYYGVIV